MTMTPAHEVYREIMTLEPPESLTPEEEVRHNYLFGELWTAARPRAARAPVGDARLRRF